jgi:hypothetical protein
MDQVTEQQIKEDIGRLMGIELDKNKMYVKQPRVGGRRITAILELRSEEQVEEVLSKRTKLKGGKPELYVSPDLPVEQREWRRYVWQSKKRGGPGGERLPMGNHPPGGWGDGEDGNGQRDMRRGDPRHTEAGGRNIQDGVGETGGGAPRRQRGVTQGRVGKCTHKEFGKEERMARFCKMYC